MIIIGIDPGKSGGIAWYSPLHGMLCEVMPTTPDGIHAPALHSLLKQIAKDSDAHVFLEKSQAMPKNGAVSMFNYGVGYGIIQGLISAMNLPMTLVPPRIWTKIMHAGADSDNDAKDKSLVIALRLFPDQTFLATDKSKKPHEGLIDAVLICEYGRRLLGTNLSHAEQLVQDPSKIELSERKPRLRAHHSLKI